LVEWMGALTPREIARVRRRDRRDKDRYIDDMNAKKPSDFLNCQGTLPVPAVPERRALDQLWRGFRKWMGI
jgi:hypothetical protein